MEPVQTVLSRIKDSLDDEGRWALPLASLSHILSIPEPELYGRLYRNMHRAGAVRELSDVVFTAGNAGELIGMLELFMDGDIEGEFTRAGLFLPHALRADLQERLVRRYLTEYIIHAVQMDAFDSMLLVARRADRAIDLYLDEYFPLDDAIRRCSAEFAHDGGFPSAMEATATHFLELLLARHILERRQLLGPLVGLLRGRARDTGYERRAEGRESRHDGNTAVHEGVEHEVRRACEVLGIEHREISRVKIRERYKALIRKYHPDVNPQGLEMSKLINTSYALLLTRCSE